jgi:hypothetical protein
MSADGCPFSVKQKPTSEEIGGKVRGKHLREEPSVPHVGDKNQGNCMLALFDRANVLDATCSSNACPLTKHQKGQTVNVS